MNQYMVSFPEAIKRAFTNYCCFTGRASRSEYWWFALFNFIVGSLIMLCFGFKTKTTELITNIYSLGVLLPSLGLCFRRLHDTGRSGWWVGAAYIPLFAVSVLVGIAAVLVATGSNPTALWVVSGIIGVVAFVLLIAVLIYTILPSQPEENKYGPVPNVDVKG